MYKIYELELVRVYYEIDENGAYKSTAPEHDEVVSKHYAVIFEDGTKFYCDTLIEVGKYLSKKLTKKGE